MSVSWFLEAGKYLLPQIVGLGCVSRGMDGARHLQTTNPTYRLEKYRSTCSITQLGHMTEHENYEDIARNFQLRVYQSFFLVIGYRRYMAIVVPVLDSTQSRILVGKQFSGQPPECHVLSHIARKYLPFSLFRQDLLGRKEKLHLPDSISGAAT